MFLPRFYEVVAPRHASTTSTTPVESSRPPFLVLILSRRRLARCGCKKDWRPRRFVNPTRLLIRRIPPVNARRSSGRDSESDEPPASRLLSSPCAQDRTHRRDRLRQELCPERVPPVGSAVHRCRRGGPPGHPSRRAGLPGHRGTLRDRDPGRRFRHRSQETGRRRLRRRTAATAGSA